MSKKLISGKLKVENGKLNNSQLSTFNFQLPKAAFTLAEVLITLGVISVVAAMTLPVIKSQIEKQVFRSQFMKQYRNFENILRYIEVENGQSFACYEYSYGGWSNKYTECDLMWNEIFKQLKIVKKCTYGTNNCSPIYKTPQEINNNGGIANATRNALYNKYTSYIMADGSILYLYDRPDKYDNFRFFIDVNGKKGPNKWGYDVFPFIFYKPSNSLNAITKLKDVPYPMCEKGGRRLKNMLLNNDNVNTNYFGE